MEREARSCSARPKGRDKGFTLYELLLVLFLMGLLLQVATPNFSSSRDRIKENVDLANIKKIEGATQLYRLDVGSFPRTVDDLLEPPSGMSNWNGPYLKELPTNPFETTRTYELNSIGQVKEFN
ncbi:MAG: type II secretion system protein GspG [Desulfitobacteriaceae bacterium]